MLDPSVDRSNLRLDFYEDRGEYLYGESIIFSPPIIAIY